MWISFVCERKNTKGEREMMCIQTIYENSCIWIGIGIGTIIWNIFYLILFIKTQKEKGK